MKRGTFIFIFIAFILVISGAAFNSNQNITPFGCGTTSSGGGNSGRDSSPDCIFTDRNLPEDNVLTYFAPAEVLAIELTAASMGINNFPLTPATFKIHVSGANPSFASREGGTPPKTTSHPIANAQRKCTLFTFTDQIQFSGSYTAKKDPQEIDPVTGEKKCYYKVIAGSDLIQGFTDCPEANPNQRVDSCADTKQCSYSFDKTYTYGYLVIADKEGCNPLVTPVEIDDSKNDAIEQAIIEAAQICRSVESAVPESECGNGQVDEGEGCDDGKDHNGNNKRCTSNCKRNICGDGNVLSDPVDMVNGITNPPGSERDKIETTYEECDDGNTIEGDGCAKDCKDENLCTSSQIACYEEYDINNEKVRGGAGWCCDKWAGDCIPQDCAFERNNCEVGAISEKSILAKDYGIKWLNTNQPFPEECSCAESTLFIIGDVISSGNSNTRKLFAGYSLSKYCEVKKIYGNKCTFAMHVSSWTDFVDKIANLALRSDHDLKRFKKLYVLTHGLPQGTLISEYGDTYGALLCNSGKADMVSCLVGQKPFFGILGTPQLVQQFCNMAPLDAQIRVSESVILVSSTDMGPYWDMIVRMYGICDLNNPDCGIYTSAGNYHCYECTGVGTAREVPCNGFN